MPNIRRMGRGRSRLAAALEPKLFVVPNGIELPPPAPRRGGRVLAVGRLIRDKGMDVVVDAVAGMQGLLTIVGDGPERARLEAEVTAGISPEELAIVWRCLARVRENLAAINEAEQLKAAGS